MGLAPRVPHGLICTVNTQVILKPQSVQLTGMQVLVMLQSTHNNAWSDSAFIRKSFQSTCSERLTVYQEFVLLLWNQGVCSEAVCL